MARWTKSSKKTSGFNKLRNL